MKAKRLIWVLALALTSFPLVGCDNDDTTTDSGMTDPDTGTTPEDSGTDPADTGVDPADTGVDPADTGVEDDDAGTADAGPPLQSIVVTASGDTRFTTLVAAVSGAAAGGGAAGDLVTGLSTDSAGPYTLFAPTNDAFVASGVDPSAATTPEAMAGLLQRIIYHVLGARVEAPLPAHAASLAQQVWDNGTAGDTSDDVSIALSLAFAGTNINGGATADTGGAAVTETIQCSNGVIHVIDRVLAPQTIAQLGEVIAPTIWAGGVEASAPVPGAALGAAMDVPVADALGLTVAGNPLTLFLPTDTAFALFAASLPPGATMDPSFPNTVLQLLGLHVAVTPVPIFSGNLASPPANGMSGVNSLSGQLSAAMMGPAIPLTFDATAPSVTITGGNTAMISGADVGGTNGVLHVIESVLTLPPSM